MKVLGMLAAFAGVEHGLGEISQGSLAPPAVVFESWPHVAAFDPLNGEPAMTLIPNLLISGVLSVLVALVLGGVAFSSPARPHSRSLLLGLSAVLLLVGGGFGPPLLGLLTGLLAGRIGAPPARWQGPATRLGARSWRWFLVAAAVAFLCLVPGTALLYAATGTNDPTLVAVLSIAAFAATALAMWSARARDRVAAGGALAQPRSSSVGGRNTFRAWAGFWSILIVTLFVAVTALTLAMWAIDPDYGETTPVTDLGFFALGALHPAPRALLRPGPVRPRRPPRRARSRPGHRGPGRFARLATASESQPPALDGWICSHPGGRGVPCPA